MFNGVTRVGGHVNLLQLNCVTSSCWRDDGGFWLSGCGRACRGRSDCANNQPRSTHSCCARQELPNHDASPVCCPIPQCRNGSASSDASLHDRHYSRIHSIRIACRAILGEMAMRVHTPPGNLGPGNWTPEIGPRNYGDRTARHGHLRLLARNFRTTPLRLPSAQW